jgi:hypothetical protein
MQSSVIGGNNVAVGTNTLNSFTGSGTPDGTFGNYYGYHVAVGMNALKACTTGQYNHCIGSLAGTDITTGSANISIGYNSIASVTTGNNNVCFGHLTGIGNTSGTALTTGSNNTLLGYQADVGSATASYRTAIGAGAVGSADNSVTLGRSSDTVLIPGTAVIASGTATPAGGSAGAALVFGTTAGFGIYVGSGAPTVSAAQGSLYLRSDGSSTSTRLYVNTNGSTGWTSFTSAT